MVRHHQRNTVVALVFFGNVLHRIHPDGGHRGIGPKANNLFGQGFLGVAPEGRDVHAPPGQACQIAHDQLSLPAAAYFHDREAPGTGLGKGQFQGQVAHPQHAQVMAVDDGQIAILIQDLGMSFRVVIDQMVQRQAQCLQAVKIVALHPGDHIGGIVGMALGKTNAHEGLAGQGLQFVEGDFHGPRLMPVQVPRCRGRSERGRSSSRQRSLDPQVRCSTQRSAVHPGKR